jgi:hypothetical protein
MSECEAYPIVKTKMRVQEIKHLLALALPEHNPGKRPVVYGRFRYTGHRAGHRPAR